MSRLLMLAVGFAVCIATGIRADEPAVDEAFREGLAKCKLIRDKLGGELEDEDREKFNAAFPKTVREIFAKFPALTPGTQKEAGKHVLLTMNAAGKGFDAFRFKTPEGKANTDLTWEIVMPEENNFDSWYILPAEGTMNGFRNFHPAQNVKIEGVMIPEKNFAIRQQLLGGELKPGTEYLI